MLRRLDDRLLPAVSGGAQRLARRRLVVAVLAVLVVAGLGLAAIAGSRRHPPVPAASSVLRVGAVQGTSIPAYASSARTELAALSAARKRPVYALVSLAGYGTPVQLAALTDGVSVVEAYLRVPLRYVQTEIRPVSVIDVQRDLDAAMLTVAASEERDAADADAQAAKLAGGSSQESKLRAYYLQSARLLRQQAQAYRSICSCVYAVVVRATPQALTVLAARPGVRIVDPAPEVASLERVVFLPVLPEQLTVVQPPPDAGQPSLPPAGK